MEYVDDSVWSSVTNGSRSTDFSACCANATSVLLHPVSERGKGDFKYSHVRSPPVCAHPYVRARTSRVAYHNEDPCYQKAEEVRSDVQGKDPADYADIGPRRAVVIVDATHGGV